MSSVKISLDGKVALVTGGSRGMGRAIALTFADAGADVVVSSRDRPLENYPTLEEVAREIRAKGRRSLAIASHVAKLEDIKGLVERTKAEFGRIDILVNNAGTYPAYGPLIDVEEWAWDVTMNVNLKGPFLLSQMVARMMREHGGGNIINIASVAGLQPDPSNIYSVSKAGLITLTRAMAKQWAPFNIRVNAIAPGFVKTRMGDSAITSPDDVKAIESLVALGRRGVPEDIAGAALYLASSASSWVTGITLVVDGGQLVGPAHLHTD